VDFERTLETQRLRLLRLVAGLVLLIGFLSVGPVSRGFSVAICRYVGSVLSRAEMAARYLVIAQAHRMVALGAFQGQRSQISESLAHAFVKTHADVSPSECQRRLKALRALLLDLPSHALRLLRRIEKQNRRKGRTDLPSPHPETPLFASLFNWRLAENRIERPPIPPSACPYIIV